MHYLQNINERKSEKKCMFMEVHFRKNNSRFMHEDGTSFD